MLEGSLELDISYSVIGVIPDGFVPGTGTLVGVNPLLGSLADNGGPTQTHLPANNSPAGALVPLESCDLDADQRGTPRPIGEGCSAGSVEVAGAAEEIVPPVPVPIMSRWGLALTAGLLAAFGLFGLRRRRIV